MIFNKDAVMILPTGTDKSSGLKARLKCLNVAPNQVICIGDAENDQDFLQICKFKVAVTNALDSVKVNADLVTSLPNGDGIAELVREYLLKSHQR